MLRILWIFILMFNVIFPPVAEAARSNGPRTISQAGEFVSAGEFLPNESLHDGQLTPWESMTDRLADERVRFQGQCKEYGDFCLPLAWEEHIQKMRGMPLTARLDYANRLINQYRYAVDMQVYGVKNYWSTPLELATQKRGDCKDHAIAKFALLLASGVPEKAMRVLVLHNTRDHYLHAILMASTDRGLFYLDDQKTKLLTPRDVPYYQPIYSINFDGWWLHENRMASL